MIVDAHHHFWDPDRADYPWMTDELGPIRRRFGPEDLAPLLARTGVERTILVQTRSSLEETGEFLAIAATTPFVAGVIVWAASPGRSSRTGGGEGSRPRLRPPGAPA